MRLFERKHGHKPGPELADDAVREIAVVHARLCLALRGFFHPAAGRELLWNLRSTPLLRPLLDEIADPAGRALVARTLDRYEERVLPRWEHLRGQVVHGDFNLDNLLVDERGRITRDPGLRRLLPHRARRRPRRRARIDPAWAAARGRVPGRADRARRFRVPAPARAAGARAARRPRRGAARGDRLDQRVARAPLPRERGLHRGLGRRLLAPARAARRARSGGGRARAGCAAQLDARPRARAPAERGARRAPDAAHLRAARPRDARRGRLDLRAGWTTAPRRLQQRPGRRALPSAGDGGGRPPDAARRDQREVSRRAAGRARRAAARHVPGGGGPRHRVPRQLGERGERPRLAARGGGDRPRRRARDRERVPRSHCRDEPALAGGLARCASSRPSDAHPGAGERRRSGRCAREDRRRRWPRPSSTGR